jgi:hypothetical protein
MIAENLVEAFKNDGLPIKEIFDYTPENDPNQLLGRPNQYISKANFHDTRFEYRADDPIGIASESGGSVEVFATHDEAQTRADYLAAVTKGIGALTEYDYVQGSTLLRISKSATPNQASAYESALRAHHVG